jgi:hypothetical protein
MIANVEKTRSEVQSWHLVDAGSSTSVDLPRAVSCSIDFEVVRDKLAKYPPPRRPNRNRPIHAPDDTERELSAWDAASDEAWTSID